MYGIDGPEYEGFTQKDLADTGEASIVRSSNVVQDYSTAFYESAKQSLGLGTAIRKGAGWMAADGVKLTPDEWESTYKRGDMEYDPTVTRGEAHQLAEFYDWSRYREMRGQDSPVGSFIGGIAGGFADPLNWVPVFGWGARGAAMGRAGVQVAKASRALGPVGSKVALGVGEGAIGSMAQWAVVDGILGARKNMGDDTSWSAFWAEAAFSGVAGGTLGGVGGILTRSKYRAKVPQQTEQAYSEMASLDQMDAVAGEIGRGPSAEHTKIRMEAERLQNKEFNNLARQGAEPMTPTQIEADLTRLYAVDDAHLENLTRIGKQQADALAQVDADVAARVESGELTVPVDPRIAGYEQHIAEQMELIAAKEISISKLKTQKAIDSNTKIVEAAKADLAEVREHMAALKAEEVVLPETPEQAVARRRFSEAVDDFTNFADLLNARKAEQRSFYRQYNEALESAYRGEAFDVGTIDTSKQYDAPQSAAEPIKTKETPPGAEPNPDVDAHERGERAKVSNPTAAEDIKNSGGKDGDHSDAVKGTILSDFEPVPAKVDAEGKAVVEDGPPEVQLTDAKKAELGQNEARIRDHEDSANLSNAIQFFHKARKEAFAAFRNCIGGART